jgi:hypothetical protein
MKSLQCQLIDTAALLKNERKEHSADTISSISTHTHTSLSLSLQERRRALSL